MIRTGLEVRHGNQRYLLIIVWYNHIRLTNITHIYNKCHFIDTLRISRVINSELFLSGDQLCMCLLHSSAEWILQMVLYYSVNVLSRPDSR